MLIHCDYCGGAFDAEKHATCPRCGAAWDRDDEVKKVEQERERRAKAEQSERSTQEFLAQADAVRRTANSVGNAVGGVYRVLRTVFSIVILLVLAVVAILIIKLFL